MIFKKKRKIVAVHFKEEILYLALGEKGKGGEILIIDWEKSTSDGAQLAEFVQRHQLKGSPAYLTLGGKQIITRVIQMPKLPKEELKEALFWEITKYIPIPAEELIFDCVQIPNANGLEENNILVFAARTKHLENYCDLLAEAGLKPLVVETEGTVLGQLYILSEANKGIKSSCCLYLDHEGGVFSFFIEDKLSFVHNLDWEEGQALGKITAEIRLVSSYLNRRYQTPEPEKILLLGPIVDKDLLKGLREAIDQAIEVLDFRQIPSLILENKEIPSEFALAMGLLLREVR